jgi:hypothetical protein
MIFVFSCCLLHVLCVPLLAAAAGSAASHLSRADRHAAVSEVFTTIQHLEPEIFRRRRLAPEDAPAEPEPAPDDPANLGVLMQHWQYQLERSKQARLLRGFGFTDGDGLPEVIPGYDLAKEFHGASQSLGLLLWHLENRTKDKHTKRARRLQAANAADRARLLDSARQGTEFPRPNFLGIDSNTGEHRFTLAGAYIGREEDRAPVLGKDGRRRLELESFELPGLSNCELSPIATYTSDLLVDDITENEQLDSGGVCECVKMHEARESIPEVGPVDQRWCECKFRRRLLADPKAKNTLLDSITLGDKAATSWLGNQDSDGARVTSGGRLLRGSGSRHVECLRITPEFSCEAAEITWEGANAVTEKASDGINAVAEAMGNGVRHYAMVANVCSSYPALGKATECKVDKSETSFPRKINCKFEFVLQKGMEIILEAELRVGFGAAGHEDQLAADLMIGIASRPFPRACWGDPTWNGLPSPSSPDFRCRAMRFLSQTLDKVVDIGELLGGAGLKDSLDLFPFKFRFPPTYDTKSSSTKVIAEGQSSSGRLKQMCRVPIQLPKLSSELGFDIPDRRRLNSAESSALDLLMKNSGAFDGMDINDPNFNTITSSVCLSTVGAALKKFGMLKNGFRYMSVGLGLSGCDFCVGTPNVTTEAGESKEDIELGFTMQLSLFDREFFLFYSPIVSMTFTVILYYCTDAHTPPLLKHLHTRLHTRTRSRQSRCHEAA